MTDMDAFIAGMPKCELHVHLEGTFEPEMKFALAERNHIQLPYKSVEEVRAGYTFHDLSSFLPIYYEAMRVLQKEPDFYDLTFAYLSKAHAENIRYAEMFFDPQAHTSRGVSFDTIIRGIRRAQMDAEQQFGLRSQLILCFLRDWSAEFAMATLLESLPYKEWIVGVGLDSDERANPPLKFREVFKRAREEGYLLTMHCDVDQENTTTHIRQCLEEIGVNRIDHGVNILEDESLCAIARERGIGFTVCPVSNGFVTGDTKAKAIKRMLDKGMRVTVNSDDPAYFGAYINENLIGTQKEMGLGKDEVVQLVRNAFEVTWLPRQSKDHFLAELDAYAG